MRAAKNLFVAAHCRAGFAASALVVMAALALAGCQNVQRRGLDPLAVGGRLNDAPISYDALMHIAAAARGAGDFATAVSLYRRAAELNTGAAAPLTGAGDTLVEMGQINEAIVAYRAALVREPRDQAALRGLARAYLRTGKPELALEPLGVAAEQAPADPKLLQLIGVAEDFAGRHAAAQVRYRQGLEFLPGDRGLSVNLALSLALSGQYGEAVAVLGPVALGPAGTLSERQTLALIYALQGDNRSAERIARLDLDPQSATRQLAYYDTLRALSPEARSLAIRSMSTNSAGARSPSI
ncbi:MAG: tetratricopeptide repeat protein [Alphaproteobacteria bacterium]